MKTPVQILAFLLLTLAVGWFVWNRAGPGYSRNGIEWQKDPKVIEAYRSRVAVIKGKYGNSVEALLEKETDPAHALDVLQVLCSWKVLQGSVLNEIERFAFSTYWLSTEVNSGGFHQYFHKATGDHWEAVYKGMIRAGDLDGAKRFEKVLNRFPGGSPASDRGKRIAQLDTFGDSQYEIFTRDDADYFENPYPDFAKVWAYIQANADQFDLAF